MTMTTYIQAETPMPEGPFTIVISEYQRALLVRIMEQIAKDENFGKQLATEPNDPNMLIPESDALGEARVLMSMLRDLPGINVKDMVHGFCY